MNEMRAESKAQQVEIVNSDRQILQVEVKLRDSEEKHVHFEI